MSFEQLERYENRTQAGTVLAHALRHHAGRHDTIVLGLPRGGVPVAAQVARQLKLPLDILVVRKIGFPGQPEFAIGAIASGGACLLQKEIVGEYHISDALIEETVAREKHELARREQCYRGSRPAPLLANQTVILVDDGMATGSTMQAAVQAVRAAHPACVIVAVPVASSEACAHMTLVADQCLCLSRPEPFRAVGLWYRHFGQVGDDEVIALLAQAGAGEQRSAPVN
jgi:putative phosphoribosyl transferase